jgi:hypothetical protein
VPDRLTLALSRYGVNPLVRVSHSVPGGTVRLRRAILSCLVVGPALLAPAALAQSPDSVAFHRGQWGTEFTIGSGFVAAGLLHFSTPARALLVDVGVNYVHDAIRSDGPTQTEDSYGASLRLGTRTYRSVERRLYRMVTLGITASYDRETVTANTVSHSVGQYGLGVFGDIGATWLVTPHLGIGAKLGATLAYSHGTSTGTRTDQLHLSVGYLTLAGQLYF